MCGRFSQAYSWEEIVAFSQPLTVPADRPNLRARYNIAPTTEIDIIVKTETGREMRKARRLDGDSDIEQTAAEARGRGFPADLSLDDAEPEDGGFEDIRSYRSL
jgi:hypothetical protein